MSDGEYSTEESKAEAREDAMCSRFSDVLNAYLVATKTRPAVLFDLFPCAKLVEWTLALSEDGALECFQIEGFTGLALAGNPHLPPVRAAMAAATTQWGTGHGHTYKPLPFACTGPLLQYSQGYHGYKDQVLTEPRFVVYVIVTLASLDDDAPSDDGALSDGHTPREPMRAGIMTAIYMSEEDAQGVLNLCFRPKAAEFAEALVGLRLGRYIVTGCGVDGARTGPPPPASGWLGSGGVIVGCARREGMIGLARGMMMWDAEG